jgi:hypothetical protein
MSHHFEFDYKKLFKVVIALSLNEIVFAVFARGDEKV